MSISGIYIVTDPDRFEEVCSALQKLPGVDLHTREPASGKLVITRESTDDETDSDGLKGIRAVPGVRTAGVVYHYLDDDNDDSEGLTSRS